MSPAGTQTTTGVREGVSPPHAKQRVKIEALRVKNASARTAHRVRFRCHVDVEGIHHVAGVLAGVAARLATVHC